MANDKTVSITVNSVDHTVPHEKISYSAIVDFAYPGGSTSGAAYIVKYSMGAADKDKHTLSSGDEVMVKNGMRFRVSPTGES